MTVRDGDVRSSDTGYSGEPSYGATGGARERTLHGGDWDEFEANEGIDTEDRIVVNFGPSHPSSHGVLRLVLELEGESVTKCVPGVGFLHTGIEKNSEFRTWTQAVTLLTRADYLSNMHTETAYCMAVERMLGVQAPRRAQLIRMVMMEVNRVSSHWTTLGATGMELGALTVMTNGMRAREKCLDVFEAISGLRMNHAYIRPGGVAQDLPEDGIERLRKWVRMTTEELDQLDTLVRKQPIWIGRLKDVGWMGVEGCLSLGITGPLLRAAGLPWDTRKTESYLAYDEVEFDVPTSDRGDCWGRYTVRVAEMRESVRIVDQLIGMFEPGPVMVDDPKIAWPAKLSIGSDGMGNSAEHVNKIMNGSMESLIHHFKLVTEGFRVPTGQVYQSVESPRGELGVHVISDGSTRPYRVHLREPSFINLQAIPLLTEGGMLSDLIASVASVDSVMGGCDR
ncbi:MAG: NADH-quinone oxidoreductase subunit D [Actinomycetota bacterium]|nr:NADH-quinone oxidoreductase subunit D [Actinomycetota bacterium]